MKPRTLFLGLVISLASTLYQPQATAATTNGFVQDRFAVGMWWSPRTDERLDQYYQEIADAHFTVVVAHSGPSIPEHLARCQRLGLKTFVSAAGPVSELPDGPACWGYLLADEPGAGAFPDLARRAEEIRKHRPGRFGYVNLFPNYAPASALGTTNYDEHVARFVREVKPEVLSMDHYPLMRPDGDSRNSYCENLETMRKYSLKAGIPFWNYFYSMPFNDRLDPTEAQIRWQIFTSVAYGAKGVLYFCYWTPGKGAAGAGEFPKGGAIITAEGLKTRHYEEATRINLELKNWGPTLMQLTNTGVWKVSTDTASDGLVGSGLRKVTRVGSDPAGEFIIGAFKHADGRRAIVIVNHNYSYTAWPNVEFDVESSRVMEVGKTTGKAETVVDDSPELKGLQLSFGAGDARLFLLP